MDIAAYPNNKTDTKYQICNNVGYGNIVIKKEVKG